MPYSTAGNLFVSAVDAYQYSKTHSLSPFPGSPMSAAQAASVSIIFAHIAAEAFINELAMFGEVLDRPDSPGWISSLADMLGDAEQSRTSTESRFQLAKFILSGRSFDRGGMPFQDFALLVRLRNMLVHHKPQEATARLSEGKFEWSDPKIVAELDKKGVLQPNLSFKLRMTKQDVLTLSANFMPTVSTPEVARWACSSAASMVLAVIDAIPPEPNHFKKVRAEAFSTHFSRLSLLAE